MNKAHDVQKIYFKGTMMLLKVDGNEYLINISEQSNRLAMATQERRIRYSLARCR